MSHHCKILQGEGAAKKITLYSSDLCCETNPFVIMLHNKDYLLIGLSAYAAFDIVLYMTYMNKYPKETKELTGKVQGQDYLWPAVAAVGVAGLAYYYLGGNTYIKKTLKIVGLAK